MSNKEQTVVGIKRLADCFEEVSYARCSNKQSHEEIIKENNSMVSNPCLISIISARLIVCGAAFILISKVYFED
jgi:hypothetical protein